MSIIGNEELIADFVFNVLAIAFIIYGAWFLIQEELKNQ
jgi:uncharacterized membrane protein